MEVKITVDKVTFILPVDADKIQETVATINDEFSQGGVGVVAKADAVQAARDTLRVEGRGKYAAKRYDPVDHIDAIVGGFFSMLGSDGVHNTPKSWWAARTSLIKRLWALNSEAVEAWEKGNPS